MSGHPYLKLLIAYSGTVFTVVVVMQLVVFLSYLPTEQGEIQNSSSWSEILTAGIHNVSLVCCFFFFHSVLADPYVKNCFEKLSLKDVQRSIYVIISCAALQLLFHSWKPMTGFTLWNFDIRHNWFLWLSYSILHVYVWVLIYVSNLLLDITELLGIKQVCFSNQNLPPPDSYKSQSFLRFRANMNHTSFLGFSLIFWIYPCMRLDRALFALLFQLYMIINWKPDSQDLDYIRRQRNIKCMNYNNVSYHMS